MTVIFTVCWTCSRANSSVFLSAPRGHYFFTCWQSTGPWVSKTWVGAEPSTLTPISGVPLWYNLSQLPFSWEDDSQLFSRADLGHNLDVCFNILLLAFFISPPRFFPLPALASSSLLLVPMTPPPAPPPLSYAGPWKACTSWILPGGGAVPLDLPSSWLTPPGL